METITLNVYGVILYVIEAILITFGILHGIVYWKYLDKTIYKIVDVIYIFLLLCVAGALVYVYPLVFK